MWSVLKKKKKVCSGKDLQKKKVLSSESKNWLNIPCNYTMTHYTILTIKQQILILTTAVYPSHARTVVRECCKGDDESQIIVKKLNSLKHLVRTTVAESHN